jgi:uncharacterized protein (DUF4415 family)
MAAKSKRSNRTSRDPEDAPELTRAWAEGADLYAGKHVVRRGRPSGSGTKTQTTVRLSNDVLTFFRESGPGWQTRMDAVLKRYVADHER